jgi:hypothetical protein
MDKMRELTRNFSHDAFIGWGECSEVFVGVLDGQQCAVKKLSPSPGIHFEVMVAFLGFSPFHLMLIIY